MCCVGHCKFLITHSTHHFPSPLPYDSDTESATEEWSAGLEGECRSQSNSNSVMLRKEHVSRRDQATRGKDIGQSTRMLTAAQAKEMSLWGAKNAGTKSPTVSLERISLNVSAGKGESGASPCSFPFGSNSTYPAEYSSRKRGPGRPVKAFGLVHFSLLHFARFISLLPANGNKLFQLAVQRPELRCSMKLACASTFWFYV